MGKLLQSRCLLAFGFYSGLRFCGRLVDLHAMQVDRSESFGQMLRRFRLRAGLTQNALAEAMVIDFSYLSKIEKGTVKPPVADKLEKAAEKLGLDDEEREALFAAAAAATDDFESWVLRSPDAQELYRNIRSMPEADHAEVFRSLIQQVRDRRANTGENE